MSNFLVSIIIPAFQAQDYIERSVRSALNQTYNHIEVVVVENGCTDRTIELVKNIKDERLILTHSEKGVSNARNKGIQICGGDYVVFLDADDWLDENAIENMISVSNINIDIVSARYFGDKRFENYEYYIYEPGSEDYIIKCLCTPTKRGNCTGNMYRTNFIKRNGIFFEQDLCHAEDSVFFTSLLVKSPVVVDLEKPVYHVYINPKSTTRNAKKDNTDDFCKAIGHIYELLSNQSKNVINAGYICALNQLLVILVNNEKNIFDQITFMKKAFQKKVFSKAIESVNISQLSGLMKYIFLLMKKKLFVLLALAVEYRRIINSHRRRAELND